MTVHSSLRDRKLERTMDKRGKRITHPGQAYASARKRGTSPEELAGLREVAFTKKRYDDEEPKDSLFSFDWEN